MVFTPRTEEPVNAFHKAYLELSPNDRIRMRDLVCDYCEFHIDTFYERLKNPGGFSKPERLVVSRLFNIDVKLLFKTETK